MHWLFSRITGRLRALFVADVALTLESEALSREADRRAALLRQANAYREEGLETVADALEQQAHELTVERPLAGILPAIEHWQEGQPVAVEGSCQPRLSTPRSTKLRKKASRKARK